MPCSTWRRLHFGNDGVSVSVGTRHALNADVDEPLGKILRITPTDRFHRQLCFSQGDNRGSGPPVCGTFTFGLIPRH
jgi:hypothetical protein